MTVHDTPHALAVAVLPRSMESFTTLYRIHYRNLLYTFIYL